MLNRWAAKARLAAMGNLLNRAAVLFAWEQVDLADGAKSGARLRHGSLLAADPQQPSNYYKLAGMYVKTLCPVIGCYCLGMDSGGSNCWRRPDSG